MNASHSAASARFAAFSLSFTRSFCSNSRRVRATSTVHFSSFDALLFSNGAYVDNAVPLSSSLDLPGGDGGDGGRGNIPSTLRRTSWTCCSAAAWPASAFSAAAIASARSLAARTAAMSSRPGAPAFSRTFAIALKALSGLS